MEAQAQTLPTGGLTFSPLSYAVQLRDNILSFPLLSMSTTLYSMRLGSVLKFRRVQVGGFSTGTPRHLPRYLEADRRPKSMAG